MYTSTVEARTTETELVAIYQLKKLCKDLELARFTSSFANWLAPKATEDDLIPPAPIERRPKEENRRTIWKFEEMQVVSTDSMQGGGLACVIRVVSHSIIIPFYKCRD